MTWTNHSKLGGIRQTLGYLRNLAIWLKRRVYNSRVLPAIWHILQKTWTLTKQAQNKRAAAHTKMERSMLNITYKERKTNIWVMERTQVMDIISNVIDHRPHQPPQRRPMDLVSRLGDHTTRKYKRVNRQPGQMLEDTI